MGVSGVAACGGIYRDRRGYHLESFSKNIGIWNALMEDLTASMMVIEIAKDKNWNRLWL